MAIPPSVAAGMDKDGMSRKDVEDEIRGTRKVKMDISNTPDDNQTTENYDEEGIEEAGVGTDAEGAEDRQDDAAEHDEKTPPAKRASRNRFDKDEEEDGEVGGAVQNGQMTEEEVQERIERLVAARLQQEQNKSKEQNKGNKSDANQHQPFELSAAERAALGSDAMAKAVQDIVSRATSRYERQIEELGRNQHSMRDSVASARTESFRADIERSVDGYGEVISSRAWQKYLNEYNPYVGGTNAQALMAADGRLDKRAVLGIFEGFTSRYEDTADGGKQQHQRRSLKSIATPSKSDGGSNPGAREKYDFKESDMAGFDRLRRSKKMSMADYQDKVAAYEKAMLLGRVKLGE